MFVYYPHHRAYKSTAFSIMQTTFLEGKFHRIYEYFLIISSKVHLINLYYYLSLNTQFANWHEIIIVLMSHMNIALLQIASDQDLSHAENAVIMKLLTDEIVEQTAAENSGYHACLTHASHVFTQVRHSSISGPLHSPRQLQRQRLTTDIAFIPLSAEWQPPAVRNKRSSILIRWLVLYSWRHYYGSQKSLFVPTASRRMSQI